MPIYKVRCRKCSKDERIFLMSGKDNIPQCPTCQSARIKVFSGLSFIPPIDDLTHTANRDRMAKGLYHDQPARVTRDAEDLNRHMKDTNAQMMGHQGFTDVDDPKNLRSE